MKSFKSTLLILATLMISGVFAKERKPFFKLWIFNELQVIDFFAGLASGAESTNAREDWETCIDGIPQIAYSLYNESKIIDWSQIMNFKKDLSEAEDSLSFILSLPTFAVDEFSTCKTIAFEIRDLVMFIIHHISPS